MPAEPGKDRRKGKRPRAKPKNDGFVVFEVDGFAQLTPEQRKWPVVSTGEATPEPERESKPSTDAGTN